jgi:hypothetical protein
MVEVAARACQEYVKVRGSACKRILRRLSSDSAWDCLRGWTRATTIPGALADPAAREKLARAQAAARTQATAASTVASTVVVATIVTLVTSAFGFVAALAWNDALTQLLNPTIESSLKNAGLPPELAVLVKAIIITLIAVIAVVILNHVARRMVKQSAINAADAESMM